MQNGMSSRTAKYYRTSSSLTGPLRSYFKHYVLSFGAIAGLSSMIAMSPTDLHAQVCNGATNSCTNNAEISSTNEWTWGFNYGVNGLKVINTSQGKIFGTGSGLFVDRGNSITVVNDGSIISQPVGEPVWYDSGLRNQGTIDELTNNGLIEGKRFAIFNNGGLVKFLHNTATGIIRSTDDAAYMETGRTELVQNDGVISGIHVGIIMNSIGEIGKLVNNNLMEVTNGDVQWNGAAVYVEHDNKIDTIENNGTIKTDKYGILNLGDIKNIENHGNIETRRTGILVTGGRIETINNYGSIVTQSGDNSSAIYIVNNLAPTVNNNTVLLNNSGKIITNNYAADGIFYSSDVSLNVLNEGEINAQGNGIYVATSAASPAPSSDAPTPSINIINKGKLFAGTTRSGVNIEKGNYYILNDLQSEIRGANSISISNTAAGGKIENKGLLDGDIIIAPSTDLYFIGKQADIRGRIIAGKTNFYIGSAGDEVYFDAKDLQNVTLQNLTIAQNSTLSVYSQEWNVGAGNGGSFRNNGTFILNNDVNLTTPLFENSGTVVLGENGSNTFNKFNINGNYSSNSGTILFRSELGDSNSPTDTLHITGDVSGTTTIQIINRNGLGAPTAGDGIGLIKVDGNSQKDNFALKSDYSYEGTPVVIGGAYIYALHAGKRSGQFAGDWYLGWYTDVPVDNGKIVNTNEKPDNTEDKTGVSFPINKPVQPVYAANAPIYEVYPQVLLELNKLGTLEQRVGHRTWLTNSSDAQANTIHEVEKSGFWMDVDGSTSHVNSDVSTTHSNYDIDLIRTRLGLDVVGLENNAGQLVAGGYFQYGHAKSDVSSHFGDGDIKTNGYGLGGTLTWYGINDIYIDGVAQAMWYDTDMRTTWLNRPKLADSNNGNGYSLSIEAGKKIAINQDWAATPQMQLSYNSIDFDDFKDDYNGRVEKEDGDSLTGRLGVALNRDKTWKSASGDNRVLSTYGKGNLYYEFLDGTEIEITGVDFRNRSDRFWGGLGGGMAYRWNNNLYSLFGEVEARSAFEDFGDSYAINGTVGFKARF